MTDELILTTCVESGSPICRHVYLMNLALGYSEDFYSLETLANMHSKSVPEVYELAYDYIQMRECFSKPWSKIESCVENCPVKKYG